VCGKCVCVCVFVCVCLCVCASVLRSLGMFPGKADHVIRSPAEQKIRFKAKQKY
jgi:hypothetical protein